MLAKHPPFRARNMDGLYKKICAGKFKRIPKSYSSDLQTIICMMLRTNPKKRPTTKQLLAHPILKEHMYLLEESIDSVYDSDKPAEPANLLNTIKLPRDLKVF